MTKVIILLAGALLLGASGCDNQQSPRGLPVKIQSEDGFIDLSIPIVQASETSKEWHLTAEGTLQGVDTEFRVTVPKGYDATWLQKSLGNERTTEDPASMYVTIESVGERSDLFVQRLAKLYGVTIKNARMKPSQRVLAVILAGDTSALKRSEAKMKMFVGKEEEDEGEFFLNIDLASHVLELAEKDPDYRNNVIKALAQ